MHVERIKIEEIDLEDKRFCTGTAKPDRKLKDSLEITGQINPVAVLKKDNIYILVTGWKRVNALREMKRPEVTASIEPFKNESLPLYLFTIYFDNRERFSELDKAELLGKFRSLCNFSDEKLLKEVLPNIGIKPSPKNLKKYYLVSQLNPEIKALFYEEYFTFEQLVMLSELDDEHYRDQIFEKLLKKVRLNNNDTREILREIYEISKREKISYGECIESLVSGSSGGINKNDFKKKVKFRRYPHLSETESEFKSRAKNVESTGNIKLFHHPYFETNEIEFRLKAGDLSDLKETVKKLSDINIESELKSLFDLVKRGE